MELCSGGDLLDRVTEKGHLEESDCAHICKSLVEALQSCHVAGIAHRDVKPENILMQSSASDSEIKLVDFGVAASFKDGKCSPPPVPNFRALLWQLGRQ